MRGALLAVVCLGAVTYGIIDRQPLAAVTGVLLLPVLLLVERRAARPLVPLDLFRRRQFVAANLVTFLAYAAIGTFFFLLALALQVVAGWSPLAAGTAVLPVTLLTLVLAGPSGARAQRRGPRLQMGLGPLVCAVGCLLTLGISESTSYAVEVLPAVALFGLGLGIMVAPLTSTALSAAPADRAGVASGVNNALARTGTLLAVAALPVVAGLTGDAYAVPSTFAHGYRTCASLCSALLFAAGLLAWAFVRDPATETPITS